MREIQNSEGRLGRVRFLSTRVRGPQTAKARGVLAVSPPVTPLGLLEEGFEICII